MGLARAQSSLSADALALKNVFDIFTAEILQSQRFSIPVPVYPLLSQYQYITNFCKVSALVSQYQYIHSYPSTSISTLCLTPGADV